MDYDVCLSFANEDRAYVAEVARALQSRAVRVFYDEFERAALWGKDLYVHFDYIYRLAARYCVVFASAAYKKQWTAHELASAQARALEEASEYLLLARFDDTELPGIRRTIRYEDLRGMEPAELADLICQKLALGLEPSSTADTPSPRWYDPINVTIGNTHDQVAYFQGIPIDDTSDGLGATFQETMRRLAALTRWEGDTCYWTQGEDRFFDRLYVTASVATALAQLGLAHDAPPLRESIEFLCRADPSSVDDRAATIFLLISHKLDAEGCLRFVEMIARHQVQDPDSGSHGSFFLPQGPSPRGSAGARPLWTPAQMHAGGASFHACHLSDALLHLPPHATEARRKAEPILTRIREFLTRSLDRNRGWLVDLQGNRTPLTLYGFAVCPALSIPLPAKWRHIAEEAFEMLATGMFGLVSRCFAIMNAWYIYAATMDEDFRSRAARFATGEAARLVHEFDITALGALELATVQRALACAVWLTDQRLSRFVAQAACAAASDVDWEHRDQV